MTGRSGLHGAEIAQIIEQIRHLTPDEIERLAAAMDAWYAAMDAAWAAAMAAMDATLDAAMAAWADARDEAMDAAMAAWDAARDAAMDAWAAAWDAAWDARDEARDEARDARRAARIAWDTARAVFMRGLGIICDVVEHEELEAEATAGNQS